MKKVKKNARQCFCWERKRGEVHEKQCLEKKLVLCETRLNKVKTQFGTKSKEFHTAYVVWLNCKRNLKDPNYRREVYQKNKTKELERNSNKLSQPSQTFADCFCLERKHSKMPHEKQCLEKKRIILQKKVDEAKKTNNRKSYNNAYRLYYVNEKKIEQHERNR